MHSEIMHKVSFLEFENFTGLIISCHTLPILTFYVVSSSQLINLPVIVL